MGGKPVLDGSHDLHLVGFVLFGKPKLTGQARQISNQRFEVFGSDPEDKRIRISITVGILNGDLRLADPAQPTDRLDLCEGGCCTSRESLVQFNEETLLTKKEWVALKRNILDPLRRRG